MSCEKDYKLATITILELTEDGMHGGLLIRLDECLRRGGHFAPWNARSNV